MARIAILYGGRSVEHDVSRGTAAAVLAKLSDTHHPILIGITREGRWYRQNLPSPIPRVLDLTESEEARLVIAPGEGILPADTAAGAVKPIDIDLVLPLLHGTHGEDGIIQGLLESASLPYAGSGVLGSAVGMDKDTARRLWAAEGLPAVPWRTLTPNQRDENRRSLWKSLTESFGTPLFVKPACAGSSVGVSRVNEESTFSEALDTAWRYSPKIMVEQAVIGREIECAVMGREALLTFPPGEIRPSGSHDFYDYDAKYRDPEGAVLTVPAQLPETVLNQVRDIAVKACRAVEAGGFARVDFLMEGESETLYLNEINTIPGMTSISLFPRMTAAGGLDFTAMLNRIITEALDSAPCSGFNR